MRKIVYLCDYCGKEFGEKKHLSINFGGYSGWVDNVGFDEDNSDGWEHIENYTKDPWVAQFCNGKCLEANFTDPKKTYGKKK